MNRLSAVILVFFLGASTLIAQTNPMIDGLIDPLTSDLSALAGGLCEDLTPVLIQPALAGDTVGAAAFDGDFPHGTVILPVLGVTLGNGIATVLHDDSHNWEFVTPIPKMITTALADAPDVKRYYDMTGKAFPYPALSAGLGFGITKDIEFLFSGMYFPQSLTEAIVNTANSSSVSSLKPQFSTGNLVVKVRKVFFRDKGMWPAMSVSLGGAFGSTTLGADIDLKQLFGGKEVELSNIGTLNLTGPVSFTTGTFGFGLDFAVSKQFLVFVPFARTGVWYNHSTASSKFDLNADFTTTDTTTGNTTVTTKKIPVSGSKTSDTVAGRLGGGFELRLGPVVYHLSADLDLASPIVNIGETEYDGLTLKTGFRVAF
jgi:hypothetical protein